ncbi:MAG: helix-turn-helix domain-containing protein [Burkholderiales bacterium]|nr:helix-turn-helix domain-containing protein [Burkholderiales bacterium]
MLLDPDRCYRAMQTHDARFDGRFFVGVVSTRIYCRPVCSAKPPKRENCTFHPSAAAAECAGFRPCLRCRPELAPGWAIVDASARVARHAANLIEDGLADGRSLEALATRLGVTDRHLRRVFQAAYGVAPVAYAQTHRLLLAKRLLTDTQMPVTEVALASGFGSVRRFNALFRERYRWSPTDLRRTVSAQGADSDRIADRFVFDLAYRPPLDWDGLLAFLAFRRVEGVEAVADGVYRRTLRMTVDGRTVAGWVEARHVEEKRTVRIAVAASFARAIPAVLALVKRAFDLGCDPDDVVAGLGPWTEARRGLRLPSTFDPFELTVRAVLGQQVTVRAATTLTRRFAEAFGEPVETPFPGLERLFPTPQRIATCTQDDIGRLGIIGARARTILALAGGLADGTLVLEPGADVEPAVAALKALPGIGDWTAQYIAMRALAWPDAFPHTDYGVMKAMGEQNPKKVLAAAEAWRPWRAYAVMHLWRSLEATVP